MRDIAGALFISLVAPVCLTAQTLSFATGNPAGLYYPLGGGLASIWSRTVAGVNMKAEVTAGSVTNLIQVAKLESDIGFSQGDSVADAVIGEGRFRDPLPLAVLGKMYPNVVHVVALASSGIVSIEDLRGKRVSVGPPGSGNAVTAWNILNALEINEDDFVVRQLNFTETSNGLKDGTLDAGFIAAGIGVAAVVELAVARDVVLVPFTDEEITAVTDAIPAYSAFSVPPGVYRGVDEPVQTPSLWNLLVVNQSMNEDLAYRLIKALFDFRPDLETSPKSRSSSFPRPRPRSDRCHSTPVPNGTMTKSSDPNGQAQNSPHPLEDALLKLVFVVAIALSCFQLWQSLSGAIGATFFRPIHLTWIIVLTFLHYPLAKTRTARLVDVGLAALTLYCGYGILSFDYRGVDHILDGLSTHDFACGLLLIVLLFEATRRSVGWTMVAIGALFIFYNAFGNLLPDVIANRGFTFERIVRFQVFSGAGLFGTALGIAAGTVFMFVLFGAFLEVTGAGRFFIDLAFAGAGRYRGGPAKASVLASAAMGSISGSAIANTVTTGALTIPMMKKLGYKPEQAAGIEAAASTGGQIMPPIMGAGAFIMAEFTSTPYNSIVWLSIAPAILYFVCTLIFVHLMAAKLGLRGMTETPPLFETLRDGFHFFYPLAIVTVLLLLNYSPPLVGAVGCAIVVLTGALRTGTRVNLRTILDGLKRGALMALPISAACATAGIVVGVIGQTGIGLQFTESVVDLAGGALWLALALIAVAALILGMGLPVTAAYIVLSVMAAPALKGLGLPLVVAHMIIFWLSQTSNVTPPIALAAFAGAGIAGARPMGAAREALKLAAGFFIIPLMMAYSGLLMIEGVSFANGMWSVGITLALILAVAIAAEGYALKPTSTIERWSLVAGAVFLVVADERSRLLGLAVVIATLFVHTIRVRRGTPST